MRGAGVRACFVVDAALAVAPVNAGEHLVGFVDEEQLERRRLLQALETALAAGELASGDEHAGCRDIHVVVARVPGVDAEEIPQLGLPLAKQRSRHDDERPAHALRQQLRDDQTGLDGLAQPHFVGKDAAAVGNALQREHHGFDLVRIRVHPAAPLRSHVATLLAGPTQANELFGTVAAVDRVQRSVLQGPNGKSSAPSVLADSRLARWRRRRARGGSMHRRSRWRVVCWRSTSQGALVCRSVAGEESNICVQRPRESRLRRTGHRNPLSAWSWGSCASS